MKKREFIICFIAISVLIILCTSFQAFAKEDGKIPDYRKISITTKEKNNAVIAREIFGEYLNSFKDEEVKKDIRLEDYNIEKINNIKYMDTYPNAFSFFVKYSVKVSSDNSKWHEGNGKKQFFKWSKENYAYVELQSMNGRYTIKTISQDAMPNLK